jgi:hypothetical protein
MTGGPAPRDPEYSDVARLIEDSRAWGVVAGAARLGAAALADSRIAAAARQRSREFGALPSTERARALAVLLTTAAIAYAALLKLIPPRSAPAIPPLSWMAVALVALVAAIGLRHGINATTKTRRHEEDN